MILNFLKILDPDPFVMNKDPQPFLTVTSGIVWLSEALYSPSVFPWEANVACKF